MITRRALLWGAAASVGGGGLFPSTLRRSVTCEYEPHASVPNVDHWVIDSSLDPRGDFRFAASRRGAPVTLVDFDVGALAMQLDAAWTAEPRPIAGITLPSSAFILERLALRHGMTRALTIEHRHRRGLWIHRLPTPVVAAGNLGRAFGEDAWRDAAVAALHDSVVEPDSQRTVQHGTCVNLASRNSEHWNGPARFVSWSLRPEKIWRSRV